MEEFLSLLETIKTISPSKDPRGRGQQIDTYAVRISKLGSDALAPLLETYLQGNKDNAFVNQVLFGALLRSSAQAVFHMSADFIAQREFSSAVSCFELFRFYCLKRGAGDSVLQQEIQKFDRFLDTLNTSQQNLLELLHFKESENPDALIDRCNNLRQFSDNSPVGFPEVREANESNLEMLVSIVEQFKLDFYYSLGQIFNTSEFETLVRGFKASPLVNFLIHLGDDQALKPVLNYLLEPVNDVYLVAVFKDEIKDKFKKVDDKEQVADALTQYENQRVENYSNLISSPSGSSAVDKLIHMKRDDAYQAVIESYPDCDATTQRFIKRWLDQEPHNQNPIVVSALETFS